MKETVHASSNNEETKLKKIFFRNITMRTQRKGLNCSRSELNHLHTQAPSI